MPPNSTRVAAARCPEGPRASPLPRPAPGRAPTALRPGTPRPSSPGAPAPGPGGSTCLLLLEASCCRRARWHGGLRFHRRSHPHRPALRGKFANRPGQPGRLTTATSPKPAGFEHLAPEATRSSEPWLGPASGFSDSGPPDSGKRRLPGPGRWGGTCGAARAASRDLGPGLQPRFPRKRGARGPGAMAHVAGSRPGAALEGAADPRGVPRTPAALPRLRGLSWKPGPEPGRRTPGRTRRGQLPHRQGSKALSPCGHDPRPASRTRSRGCGWVRGQVFVVSLFPPARGHRAASGPLTRTHTQELSGRTVWTALSPGFSRAADDVNTQSLQFSPPSPSQRPSWEG